ncbi:MAG: AAA family ATPase [Alphaproteobacteria bacterium]|nr:AAA family ATPase [Alphaproteobacteria bacterium]
MLPWPRRHAPIGQRAAFTGITRLAIFSDFRSAFACCPGPTRPVDRSRLAALLDQLEVLARQKPVLMLFEDFHWADATSLEVLDLTVERVRALPVLMLITFRPEY